jgi:hypothetical protein
MTVSEKIFEQLCRNRQVHFEPIPTTEGRKSADYRVWLGQVEAIVEVKQIDPNDHDRDLLDLAHQDHPVAIPSKAHIRIRNKFDKAKKQLKNLSGGKLPALFILYDNTNRLSRLSNEDFLNAMYGDEILQLFINKNSPRPKIEYTFHTFGQGRKLAEDYNRSVSAFCRLITTDDNTPFLWIFHNEFSTAPLSPQAGRIIAEKQFARPSATNNEYRFWKEIQSADE